MAALRRGPWPEGRLFSLYLALYAAGRFALEFWREPAPGSGALTLAQWTCAGALVWLAAGEAKRLLARPRPLTTVEPGC